MRAGRADDELGFHVWNTRDTWYWFVVYPNDHAAAIGAATTKLEAEREARAAIAVQTEPRCNKDLCPF